ncbi:HD-GYP domain-containing protein [Photobacterium sp. MCCC 1A19761]|uniref:HD-GYP domain-containing protein n=1 Tax=Photobacterium sp. MCCC 1A19761 TaxID=3115000 RepID=UPI00307F5D84
MSSIKISIERIQVGLHIKLPLQWMDHPFLFSEFKIKDQQQINLIRRMGLEFVYVLPEKSDTSVLPPGSHAHSPLQEEESRKLDLIAEELWKEKQQKINIQKDYRRKIQRCEKNFSNSMSQLRSVLNKINSRPLSAVQEAELLVDSLVDTLLSADNVTLHLMSNKKEKDDIYFHSLNVAVLSMIVAKANNMSSKDIKTIAIGALFHDMGKGKIPTAITRKTVPLTKPEEHYFQLHPQYSLELANLANNFPPAAKPILNQHHECIDGSGYPHQLKGKEIDLYAQLVAVTDAYDRLCHPQNPAKRLTPHCALSVLFSKRSKQYNDKFMALLARSIGIYPPGSVVQLSNQQLGLVISVNSDRLLFPNVLLYSASVPANEALILDLAESNLKIIRAISPEKLPPKVSDYLNLFNRHSYYFDSDD